MLNNFTKSLPKQRPPIFYYEISLDSGVQILNSWASVMFVPCERNNYLVDISSTECRVNITFAQVCIHFRRAASRQVLWTSNSQANCHLTLLTKETLNSTINSKHDTVKIMSDPILSTVIKLFFASHTALKNEKEKSKKEISLLFFFYRVIKRAPISQINTLQIHFEN